MSEPKPKTWHGAGVAAPLPIAGTEERAQLREVYTFAGGPFDGQRDCYDLLDTDVPEGSVSRFWSPDGMQVAVYTMRGTVWHYNRMESCRPPPGIIRDAKLKPPPPPAPKRKRRPPPPPPRVGKRTAPPPRSAPRPPPRKPAAQGKAPAAPPPRK